jgi:hypothetical protein
MPGLITRRAEFVEGLEAEVPRGKASIRQLRLIDWS